MNKQPNPELLSDDNPEWSDADFALARPAHEVLPELVGKELATTMLQPKRRGKQKAPTKELVSIRYSPEVIEQFKASGKGWQARMDAALQDWLKHHDPKKLHV